MRKMQKIFRGSPHYYERVHGTTLGQNQLDFLSINLPPVCNYRCEFCFSGMNGTQRTENSLSMEEIQQVIVQAASLDAFHIEISGEGEPLVYKNTVENIVDLADFLGIHTTIFTNGSLLTEQTARYLSGRNTSLAISLDYMDCTRYAQFTGRDLLATVIENIETARDAYRNQIRHYNGYLVLPLAIHAIATADNTEDIPRIRQFAGDDVFFSAAPMINRGNARNSSVTSAFLAEESDGTLINSDSSVHDIGRPVCGTFYYGIGVRHDGEVLFDAHAYDTAGLFGNIRSAPLQDLLGKVRNAQRTYFDRFDDGGFCPLRNPRFDEFVEYLRQSRG